MGDVSGWFVAQQSLFTFHALSIGLVVQREWKIKRRSAIRALLLSLHISSPELDTSAQSKFGLVVADPESAEYAERDWKGLTI